MKLYCTTTLYTFKVVQEKNNIFRDAFPLVSYVWKYVQSVQKYMIIKLTTDRYLII